MKKIVTALTMGALVAGSAFADFTVNANYRQRANLYTNYEGNVGGKYAGFVDAYDGNGSDNLTMKMKGDIVTFDFMAVTDQAATKKIRFKNVDAEVKLGPVTLFAGTVSDGKSNGAYRVKSDGDAGAFEGVDFEYKKLGSIYAHSPSKFVDNPLQNVAGAGENYAASLKYSLDADFGKLDLSGWYISNEASDTTGAAATEATTWSKHTLSFLADASLGFGKVEAIVKVGDFNTKKLGETGDAATEEATAVAFGAYVQPQLPVPGLTLTVGGNGSLIAGAFTDWGVDLRARYATGALSISSFHAFSGLTDDGVVAFQSSKNKWNADKGIAPAGVETANLGKVAGDSFASTQVMSNNILVRYAINERFAVTGIFADMIWLGDYPAVDATDTTKANNNTDVDTQIDLRFSAWLQIYAAKKAYVNIGLVEAINNVNEANEGTAFHTFAVPVIFRVQM
ncbi:MAG: hypothetical protein K6B43_09790 [Treponema sp.]|nr:hypothetical protein [Treponema sp.]